MKHLLGLLIVVILCAGCKSSLNNAEPLATPIVTDFSPKSGPIGEIVTLYGTNFPTDTTLFTLLVGNAKVRILSATPDSVQFMIPDTANSNLVTLKFNGKEILTKDSLKIVNGLTFYPKVAHVGDTIEVHCRPALNKDQINLGGSYTDAVFVKCSKIGPATWIFVVPGGPTKRQLRADEYEGVRSKDFLEVLPKGSYRLVSVIIDRLRFHTSGANYMLPLDTITSKFAKWDTTKNFTLKYSDWISQCDDPTSFCLSTKNYYTSYAIIGNIKLDTINSIITSFAFFNKDAHHEDVSNDFENSQNISLSNIPFRKSGDTLVAEIKGKEVAQHLDKFLLEYSRSGHGNSGYGSATRSSSDSVEVLDNTSISISILR